MKWKNLLAINLGLALAMPSFSMEEFHMNESELSQESPDKQNVKINEYKIMLDEIYNFLNDHENLERTNEKREELTDLFRNLLSKVVPPNANGEDTNNIIYSLENLLNTIEKSGVISSYSPDNFEDLNEEDFRRFINLIRSNENFCNNCNDIQDKMEFNVSHGLLKDPSTLSLSNDQNGDLTIAIKGERGVGDNLYGGGKPFSGLLKRGQDLVFGSIEASEIYSVNAVNQVLTRAQRIYYAILNQGHLRFEGTPDDNFDILNLLYNGNKIRIVGHGFNANIAELLTYFLKKRALEVLNYDQNKKFIERGIDLKQIQAISLNGYGYLAKGSSEPSSDFQRTLEGCLLRLKHKNDTIGSYNYTGEYNNQIIFGALNSEISPSSWHDLDPYMAEFVNQNNLAWFRLFTLYYYVLNIELQTLTTIYYEGLLTDDWEVIQEESSDNQEISQESIMNALYNLMSLKSNIKAYIDSNDDEENLLEIMGELKNSAIRLEDFLVKNNEEDFIPATKEIIELLERKETLFKRKNSLNVIEEQRIEEIQNLKAHLENDSVSLEEKEAYFNELIRHVGHSPQMLKKHDQIVDGLIYAMKNFLIEYEIANNEEIFDLVHSEFYNNNSDRIKNYLDTLAMGKLNLLAGGSLEPTEEGETGAMFVLDLDGNKIGLFKAESKETFSNWFKANIAGQRKFLSEHPLAQPFSECASFYLSKELGFNIAPITVMTTFKINGSEKKAAFMEFIDGKETSPNRVRGRNCDKNLINEFQKVVIFDYLIGNLDRHMDNIFEIDTDHGISFVCIDNANAFPTRAPEIIGPLTKKQYLDLGQNMYAWEHFAIAKEEFSNEAKTFIYNALLNDDQIERLIDTIDKRYPEFLTDDIIEYFYKRLNVLQSLKENDKISSPKELAQIKSIEDIEDYIHDLQ